MSHSHSGAQIIPKDGAVEATIDDVVQTTQHIRLVRTVNDPRIDIARGLDEGKFSIHKFGSNAAVPNGSVADIWSYGPTDALINWPVTTEGFRVRAGGDVADDAGGTGAREIEINFLDGTGNEVTELVALAGVSASASTIASGRRINRMRVTAVGAVNGNNVADIIVENDVTNEVVAVISAGIGQTQQTMYTVPLGFTGHLWRIELSVAAGTNKDANIQMWQRLDAYTTSAPFGPRRLVRQWLALQGFATAEFFSQPSFPALTDLWFDGEGNGAATAIDIDYDILCIREPS